MQHIRNFSIIAHIDHGKSTLADRFIQRCGGLSEREMSEQVLDSMDLERERGITIKAQTAALSYTARDGKIYNLNLIDTPGHVDFSYEVSRSLAACEGALLVVDASQGVEAQTVANCYTAIEQGVEVVPVLNKIDLPAARPDEVIAEIEDVIGINAKDAIRASAKTGEGVEEILEAVILRIPHPKGDPEARLKALIIERADVVIHNLKFGALDKYGLAPAALVAEKPSLVCCNLNAFGAVGPMRDRPGYDPMMQAYSGLMSLLGEDGRPPVRVTASIIDMGSATWSVVGILAALRERDSTG